MSVADPQALKEQVCQLDRALDCSSSRLMVLNRFWNLSEELRVLDEGTRPALLKRLEEARQAVENWDHPGKGE